MFCCVLFSSIVHIPAIALTPPSTNANIYPVLFTDSCSYPFASSYRVATVSYLCTLNYITCTQSVASAVKCIDPTLTLDGEGLDFEALRVVVFSLSTPKFHAVNVVKVRQAESA